MQRTVFFFFVVVAAFSAALVACAPAHHPFPHPLFAQAEAKARGFISDASDAPTVTDISSVMGPPGQWLYVSGTNFETGPGNTSVYLVPASSSGSVSGLVPLNAFVYNPTSLGCTIPPNNKDTFVRVVVETRGGRSKPSEKMFIIAAPVNPPAVRGFSASTGGTDCWLYVGGENFVVDKTVVHMGGAVIPTVAVYDSQSMGFNVPSLLKCTDAPVTLTVETPNGKTTSTMTYTIVPSKTGGFC